MKLEDYLKEKLNITDEEAEKITNVFKEYKKTYGHAHHHDHEKKEVTDIYSMINESKEDCESNNYDLDKIHCNGCPNNCTLKEPNCGRGKMLKEEITKR